MNKIIGFLLLIFSPSVFAQSLQEMINTALERNYQIVILKNENIIASNNNTAGNAGQLPVISANGSYSNAFNNTRQVFADGTVRQGSNAYTNNLNFSLLANWTLFDGFRVYARKDYLSALEQISSTNADYYIQQTVADIVALYYQLIREKQLLKHYQQVKDISAFRLKTEEQRKKAGAENGMTYQQSLIDYQSDSSMVIAQKSVIRSLEIQLNRITVSDLEQSLDITENDFPLLILDSKENLIQLARQNSNELKSVQLQEIISESLLRMEKADRFPKINLYGGYQYAESYAQVGFMNKSRSFGPVFGATVSFNLYNGGNTSREIKNAAIEAENANLSKSDAERNIQAGLIDLVQQYENLQARLQIAKDNAAAAERVTIIAGEQYKQGAINGIDFRITQLTLLDALNTVTQLSYAIKLNEISVYRICGTVLKNYMG